MVILEFDDQQLAVLAEIIGTVAMPMKITLPLMQHIEKQVNEQRQAMPDHLKRKSKTVNGIKAAPE